MRISSKWHLISECAKNGEKFKSGKRGRRLNKDGQEREI